MSTYYVDSLAGCAGQDGRSPETAVSSWRDVTVQPGDSLLFKRGSFFRDVLELPAGTKDAPLYVGAYGEGEKPVFNGNLFTAADCAEVESQHPDTPVMLGRGLLANPALSRVLTGGAPATADELRSYHDALLAEYSREYPAEQAHSRMREHMKYVSCCFDGAEKALKAIRKSTPKTYPAAVAQLFALPLSDTPGYRTEVFPK